MAALALALLAVAVLRGGGPDPGERADALRAALREAPAAAPDLELGPSLGAAAAPASAAPDADAVLDRARRDPMTASFHPNWRPLKTRSCGRCSPNWIVRAMILREAAHAIGATWMTV